MLQDVFEIARYFNASEMCVQVRTDGYDVIIRKKTASLLRGVRDSQNNILKASAL